MADSSKEPKFTLRLVIDEEKKKVVLAEAGKDFVDVLFGLLTLPMGTIIKLLEKHRNSETITFGCFRNLYKSVVQMGIDDFETEVCKQILLNPRSVRYRVTIVYMRDVDCKSLKLNINPIKDVNVFRCSSFSRCKTCSNFNTSLCRCGGLMNKEIGLSDTKVVDNIQNGVFVSNRCSTFIVTDDLRMEVRSTELVLEKLNSLGYGDLSKLRERLVDIGFKEVLTILEYTLSSNAPLTYTFLNKKIPRKCYDSPSPYVKENGDLEKVITLSVFLRKQDMKIWFVECGEDFVDLLFTFLAVPLESVLELSGDSSTFGCIGNLFKSFKDLMTPAATQVSVSKSVIPYYYKCQKQLLNIITEKPPVYYRYMVKTWNGVAYCLTTNCNHIPTYSDDKLVPVVLIDPKSYGSNQSREGGSGFVKRETKFTVSDDLIVTLMTSTSAFCLLKKFQIHAEDLEVREISISKTEAMNLLRASFVTSSALNTALRNLILKKQKEES